MPSRLTPEEKLAVFRKRKKTLSKNSEWPSPSPKCEEVAISSDSDRGNSEVPVSQNTESYDCPHDFSVGLSAFSCDSGVAEKTTEALELPCFTHPLMFSYFFHKEDVSRYRLLMEEKETFLWRLAVPFSKGCERIGRLAQSEVQVLRDRLASTRASLHVADLRVGSSNEEDLLLPNSRAIEFLKQQHEAERNRFAKEITRLNQRRIREKNILQEGFANQVLCLEDQIKMLKGRLCDAENKSLEVDVAIRSMERSLSFEQQTSSSDFVRSSNLKRMQQRRSQPKCQTGERAAPSIPKSPSSSPCPSSNPWHSTVVASLDGSSWRSVYLAVTAQGMCWWSESMSNEGTTLFGLNEVVSIRQGNSKHSQRPLLLSVSFGEGRQLDIALSDKSERELWRQAFKIRSSDLQPVACRGSAQRSFSVERENEKVATGVDSVASTPSISSTNPVVTGGESPSLKKWLESQADNVRIGDFDAAQSDIQLEGYDVRASEFHVSAKKPIVNASSSPVPSKPPLATPNSREFGAMSTSSRDRLPPLAPQQKRRSTVSGSASTADSLTEEELAGNDNSCLAVNNDDDHIAPVSHSSDSGASVPSSDDSVQLSPELTPLCQVDDALSPLH